LQYHYCQEPKKYSVPNQGGLVRLAKQVWCGMCAAGGPSAHMPSARPCRNAAWKDCRRSRHP
jgi:hypothetical protein